MPKPGYLSAVEAADVLGVSSYTIQNWVKLRVIVSRDYKETKHFSRHEIEALHRKILRGDHSKLQKRANKKFSSVPRKHKELNTKAVDAWLARIGSFSSKFSLETILCSIARYLLAQQVSNLEKTNPTPSWIKQLHLEIKAWIKASAVQSQLIDHIRKNLILPPPTQDLLGKAYQHLSTSSSKAQNGIFYTPSWVSAQIIDDLQKKEDRFLDPCCGSGSFLIESLRKKISLGESRPLSKLHGMDRDPLAVRICRINLLLEAKGAYTGTLQVFHADAIGEYLKKDSPILPQRCDFIATNPPWGANSSWDKKLKAFEIAHSDSAAAFLDLSLRRLSEKGRLSFLLPESISSVDTHSPIRKTVLSQCSKITCTELGRLFDGLVTDVIRLDLSKIKPKPDSMVILKNTGGTVSVLQSQVLQSPSTALLFNVSKLEKDICEKIFSFPHLSLKKNAEFCMGIVTGDNAKHLKDKPGPGREPVLLGKDIESFRVTEAGHYIKFDPSRFQQCAQERFFRAKEKLVYRFIANRLIFAYDGKRRLTLNSANIVIPKVGMHPKVVLGILQSDVLQFIFRTKFKTLKILKGHLEALPLFVFSKEIQDHIEVLVGKILDADSGQTEDLITQLNTLIYSALHLSPNEIQVIERFLKLQKHR